MMRSTSDSFSSSFFTSGRIYSFVIFGFVLLSVVLIYDRMLNGIPVEYKPITHDPVTGTGLSHHTQPQLQPQLEMIQQQLTLLQHQISQTCNTSITCSERRPFTIDIVVARYRELDERHYLLQRVRQVVPPDTHIRVITYNKYDHTDRVLPNVGRDPHTYLCHMIHEYDTLADATLFVHGSFRSPAKFEKLEHVLRLMKDKGLSTTVHYDTIDGPMINEAGFELAEWHSTHPGNLDASKDQTWTRASIHPLGEWQKSILGIDPSQKRKSTHGTFLVGRDIIRRNSLQDYEKWRKVVADGGPNGEVMHYMERSFHAILERPGDE